MSRHDRWSVLPLWVRAHDLLPIKKGVKPLDYQRQLEDICPMRYRNMHKTIYCSYTT